MLSGLVKRIDRGVKTIPVNSLAALDRLEETLARCLTVSLARWQDWRSSPAVRGESAAAIALELARAGAQVDVGYRSGQDEAEEVARESAGAPSRPTSPTPRRPARLVEEAGDLDILVNNAGITRDGLIARMSDEDWDEVLDTNLGGVFHTCRAAARGMMKRRSGAIVNITSVVGVHGNPGQTNYAASKAGIIGFTKALARELAPRRSRERRRARIRHDGADRGLRRTS